MTSDLDIILALRDGDGKAIDQIIERYKGLVRKKAGSMFILGADKEDLIQEGMIGLFKAVRDYDPGRDASFHTFADLDKAVEAGNRKKHAPLNSYISIYEDESADGKPEDGAQIPELLLAEAGKSPEDMLIDKETAESLEQKIYEGLSDFEQKVLNLKLTGLSYTDIAKILGRDEKSTDNALSRIKIKVRKILKG